MKITCGIIGLPNVGKSTLFNLLTNISVRIENYPFSTIQPNIAMVHIPDIRLFQINQIVLSKVITPGTIEFIDIAGLIKGASKGEGLGYQIFPHMRKLKILCHVVRCFDNTMISHIANHVNPQHDVDIINTELILFDILQCEKNITIIKKNRKIINHLDNTLSLLKKCLNNLYHGVALRNAQFSKDENKNLQKYNFLTIKPVIYVANVDIEKRNNIYFQELKKIACNENTPIVSYHTFNHSKLDSYNKNNQIVLNMISNHIISLLKLKAFFTVNRNMIKSWIYPQSIHALEAAYKVHSDFQKGFIRAQIIRFNDFITNHGEFGSKKSGKIFFVGKDYQIEDGDIIKFLFQK